MIELNETWDEIRTRLTRYVSNKVDTESAEDIVHDILLRVIKNQDKLITVDQPMAWIYKVAKNRITDYYRHQSKMAVHSSDANEADFMVDERETSRSTDEEFSKCLRPLLDQLDAKYSEALILVDFNEMNQAEAAAKLGVSLSAMKSRIQRGRAQLKNKFLDCCSVEMNRFGRVAEYQYRKNDSGKECC